MFLKKTTAFLKNAVAFGVKRPVVFLKRRGVGVIVKIFLFNPILSLEKSSAYYIVIQTTGGRKNLGNIPVKVE